MHNASAGKEDHSARQLIDEIRRAGHHVVARVGRRKELAEALEEPCDLVVVAGGDGTVGKAARILAGRTTPMAIVPLARVYLIEFSTRFVTNWRTRAVSSKTSGVGS